MNKIIIENIKEKRYFKILRLTPFFAVIGVVICLALSFYIDSTVSYSMWPTALAGFFPTVILLFGLICSIYYTTVVVIGLNKKIQFGNASIIYLLLNIVFILLALSQLIMIKNYKTGSCASYHPPETIRYSLVLGQSNDYDKKINQIIEDDQLSDAYQGNIEDGTLVSSEGGCSVPVSYELHVF